VFKTRLKVKDIVVRSLIPLLLLSIPILEIAVFILVGSKIGVLSTLVLIFATTLLGAVLLRVQGFGVIKRIRRILDEGHVPAKELVHGSMIFLAGILLFMPGFITDAIGLLLFIPAAREFGWSLLRNRIVILTPGHGSTGPAGRGASRGRTIDLATDEYSENPNSDSPWRRIERD